MNSPARPVALVTGSGTGVGKACILQFAQMGWDVVVNFSKSEKEAKATASAAESHGVHALLVQCDVGCQKSIDSMITQVSEQFGRLDVLVNNAATTEFLNNADLTAMTNEAWDRILAVNLKGAFFCCQSAESLLAASPRAAIVNVSSTAGKDGQGSCIAYAASKGGLNTMTKTLAKSLAPKNIRVNAVLPGPIDSRWIREANNGWDLEKMTQRDPIPRPSQPDDIADAIIFLATQAHMVTGVLLEVDGGRTI